MGRYDNLRLNLGEYSMEPLLGLGSDRDLVIDKLVAVWCNLSCASCDRIFKKDVLLGHDYRGVDNRFLTLGRSISL